ncbi:MAG: biotin-dependent carboxyltransferase family protein [Vicinamibacterales bacterium]
MAGALEVVRAGLLTTVQDLGRWGYQALGVPVSGAMDTMSLRLANALVGNAPEAAGLEVTLMGPALKMRGPQRVALAGADFEVRVGSTMAALDSAFDVPDGAVVTFGTRRSGARAYLAVAGGIDVPPVLGSRSTHLVSRMGGIDGRALVAGDVLPVGAAHGPAPAVRRRPPGRSARGPQPLRVLLGPQDGWFSTASREAFFDGVFVVSPQSDRMGYRLEGPPLVTTRPSDLISEPVAFGAIQVPSGGAPILLMADRQTAGGYPKIATVVTADLPMAGQLAPGDQVRFVATSRSEALAALIAREREWLRAASPSEDAP